jgi:hypothetical protein
MTERSKKKLKSRKELENNRDQFAEAGFFYGINFRV